MKTEHPGILRSTDGSQPVLLGATARGRIAGLAFELEVEQKYHNPHDHNVEVVYTFPLAWDAVLLGVEVEIGGKRLTGVVEPKAHAEERYEEAIAEGHAAIMLQRAADGLATLNFGNLLAGEEAVIRYRHAQLLRVEQGRIRATVPTCVAPRYGASAAGGLAPHQAPAHAIGPAYPLSITVDVLDSVAAGAIGSPSHTVNVQRIERGARVALAGTGFLDRDFILTIDGLDSTSFASLARDGDGWIVHASFCPPPAASAQRAPVRLKMLIDCSGSMAGDGIEIARISLMALLDALAAYDCFAISCFGSSVRHLVARPVLATERALADARKACAEIDADMGGTELARALSSVYASGGGNDADVLLITDGEVWNVDELVAQAMRSGHRVFAVGVGSSPAESLLRRLAEETGGACEFVAPNEGIREAALRLLSRARNAAGDAPTVEWPGTPEWTTRLGRAIHPGDTLHAFARYAAQPTGSATLSWIDSTTGAQRLGVVLPAQEPVSETALPRIAAARHIEALDAEAATEAAVRYQLLTAHTHFIVVHQRAEGERAEGLPEIAQVPQMLAAGWGGSGRVMAGVSAALGERRPVDRCMAAYSMDHFDIADSSVAFRRSSPRGARNSPSLDQLDLPSFSRSPIPADLPTPAEFVAMVCARLASGFGRRAMPSRIDELVALGLPREVIAAVRRLIEAGTTERLAVAALVMALLERFPPPTADLREMMTVRRRLEARARRAIDWMREMMASATEDRWPAMLEGVDQPDSREASRW